MTDLSDEDRATIAAIREQTASSSESERAEFIYSAGLTAGNKERDQMLAVIEAAKAMRHSRRASPRTKLESAFDPALSALEGDK